MLKYPFQKPDERTNLRSAGRNQVVGEKRMAIPESSASNQTTSAVAPVGATSGSNSGGYKRIVYIICAVAALGGLLFGLDQGFIANSLATIDADYHLGVQGGERYSAILATGGIIGALLSGIFARFLGRKKSLLLAGFIFTAASALSAMLPPLRVLSACRFALGFGVGVASFIVPLYLA